MPPRHRRAAPHPRRQPSTAERVREVGTRGEGGDRTLMIDAEAEEAVFRELEALHDEGLRFTAVSEERGTVDFGDPDMLVVVDPIDGSVNAKRGLPHHSISIAVAAGDDDGRRLLRLRLRLRARGGVDRAARQGRVAGPARGCRSTPASAAAATGGSSCSASSPPTRAGCARRPTRWPRALPPAGARDDGLDAVPGRRGAARRDGVAAALPRGRRRRRAADRARGGRLVAFPWCDDPLGAPLDLAPHSPIVAARTGPTLAELRESHREGKAFRGERLPPWMP